MAMVCIYLIFAWLHLSRAVFFCLFCLSPACCLPTVCHHLAMETFILATVVFAFLTLLVSGRVTQHNISTTADLICRCDFMLLSISILKRTLTQALHNTTWPINSGVHGNDAATNVVAILGSSVR